MDPSEAARQAVAAVQETIDQDDRIVDQGNDGGTDDAEAAPSSSSSSSYEEDEEETEPLLKYHRLQQTSVVGVSTMCVHERFLAIGTHAGLVHVLDFNGNEVRRFARHSATVNRLCVDAAGEWVASAADDGRVSINALYGDERVECTYGRPMLALALDPLFGKKTARPFCCGGRAGQLILNTKGFFRAKDTVLHSGEGPIYALEWCGSLIAWANDVGVKLFDTATNQRISYIDRPKGSPRADLYRCHLYWADESTLLIGWADQVKVTKIRQRHMSAVAAGSAASATDSSASAASLPAKYVEIVAAFQTDYWVCGLASYGQHLVTLAYMDEEEDEDEAAAGGGGGGGRGGNGDATQQSHLRPELRITSLAGEELCNDALTVHGFERYLAHDYGLCALRPPPPPVPLSSSSSSSATLGAPEAAASTNNDQPSVSRDTHDRWNTHRPSPDDDMMFYVVSPADIVVARPRDLDDHVAWLMERGLYEEALAAADDALMHTHKRSDVGEKYIEHLLNQGRVQAAAELGPSIFGSDAKLWEQWIFRFAQLQQLAAIAPVIPTKPPVVLGDVVYEMVLSHFLNSDHEAFLRTVEQWPHSLYSLDNIVTAVRGALRTRAPDDPQLLDALALLYTYAGQYDKTLEIYLRRKHGNVFELIAKYDLFDAVRDRVRLLVEFDTERAVTLLASHPDRLPIGEVVEQLRPVPRLLHAYLHKLFVMDCHVGREFHELQIELYAEFAPSLLLPFLRQSNNYKLERALEICQRRNLIREQVFVLGRMGNNRQALTLIMTELQDVRQAIEFVQGANDDELWADLIDQSMSSPRFVAGLLEHIGAHVDPITLIRRIPEGMQIEGLRDRLVKIISDFSLQCQLREGCNHILKADCVDLFSRLTRRRTSALRVDHGTAAAKCATCAADLLGVQAVGKIVFFWCGHGFHKRCLSAPTAGSRAPGDPDQSSELPAARQGKAAAAGLAASPALSSAMANRDLVCTICQSKKRSKKSKGSSVIKK